MHSIKFFYLILLSLMVLTIPSCGNDDDGHDAENSITITIEEPVNDEIIETSNCADVHIHIEFEATDENHEVFVVLHPEGDVNDKIIDFNQHDHDRVIEFEQGVDLCSYAPGTCFHLEVEACADHDCQEVSTAEVKFCLE